jgi:hypothetical protein
MTHTGRRLVSAVALLLLADPCVARADYHTMGNEFTLSNHLYNGDRYGYFAMWTNDGRGASNIDWYPKPGEVKFEWGGVGQPYGRDYPPLTHNGWDYPPVYGNNLDALRVDGFAFNTDLKLTASQIKLPPGWTVKPNSAVSGFGTFSWLASASNLPAFQSWGDITIDGLGADATPDHFRWTTQPDGGPPPSSMVYVGLHMSGLTPSELNGYATEHWMGVATLTTPEPGSLALAVLGLGALGLRILTSSQSPRCRTRCTSLPSPPP